MRKFLVGIAILTLVAVACAPEEETGAADTPTPTDTASPEVDECATDQLALKNPGQLTVGTGNPAFPPWWEGGETEDNPEWEFNDPHLLQGFEGGVVEAIADELGFDDDDVSFVDVGFNRSFAPGPKDFDFVLQQISYSDKRAEAVDFSESYYDVNQALVTNAGSSIEGATTIEELKGASLGAPIGTTSYTYIEETIQPDVEPSVFDDLNAAVTALNNGRVDGIVVDLPTAFFIVAVQLDDGAIVGQFPSQGQQEYFALAFEKGSGLVECADQALQALKADGTLDAIQQEWLADNASAPVIEG
jgi:polar amino acid transport system substrate-binding protein